MLQNKILFILFLGYFMLIAFYMNDSCMKQQWCGQDMDQYIDYSTNLLTGHGYSAQKVTNLYFLTPTDGLYVPETMRLPGYPLLLTLGRVIYNNSNLLIIYHLFFISFIMYFSYKLFTVFFKKHVIIPLLLLCASPTLLYYTTRLGNVDLFSYAMVTGFMYGVVHLYKKEMTKKMIILTFICGLAAIFSRQNTLLFIFPVLLFPFIEVVKKRKVNPQAKVFSALMVGLMLILGVWVGRNYLLTNSLTLSTASSTQLFNEYVYFSLYPNADTQKLVKWIFIDKWGEKYMTEQLKNHVPVSVAFTQLNKQLDEKTYDYIRAHPELILYQFGHSIRSLFFDPTFNWKEGDFLEYLTKQDKWISKLLFYSFFIYPVFYLIKKDKDPILLSMWIGAVLYVLFSAFFHGTVVGNRGILPLYTVIVLLSLSVWVDILRKVLYGNSNGKKE